MDAIVRGLTRLAEVWDAGVQAREEALVQSERENAARLVEAAEAKGIAGREEYAELVAAIRRGERA